ncbi:MAG: acyl-CoA dehydrogenase [Natrialbaceae archaeon]|nr:acyl-CoA dehydrogenase [Natrialbaceae archaeon]
MGLTEANAGVNTLKIDTTAERDGDEFLISGQKMWISGVDHADYMLLIARTSPFEGSNPTHGITLFIVPEPAEQEGINLTEVETMVPWFERQFQVDIDGLRLSEDDVLGGPEKIDVALYDLWDTLNTERIAGAASVIGAGLRAIDLAVEYANDRVVFKEPIGSYQSMQHPLADAYTHLMTAREMTYKASWKWDEGKACGEESNMAKLQASTAALDASSHAIQVHGGYGFTPEAEVMPIWMNARLIQTAPVPNEMVRNYIAEHVLGLPRSFLR